MSKIDLPDNHLTFSSKEAVKDICQPLVQKSAIDHFYYARLYPDNSFIRLGNNLEWHQYCLAHPDKIFKKQGQHFKKHLHAENDYTFFEKEPSAANTAKQLFGLHSFISLVKNTSDYVEELGFATKGKESLYGFYLTHPDILFQFGLYFKEKAKGLISDSEKHYRIPVQVNMGFPSEPKTTKDPILIKLPELRQEITPKQYVLSGDCSLSPRQLACVERLAKGMNVKEIGVELNIASRTVREHINRAKEEGGYQSKSKLLNAYFNSDLCRISHPPRRLN